MGRGVQSEELDGGVVGRGIRGGVEVRGVASVGVDGVIVGVAVGVEGRGI